MPNNTLGNHAATMGGRLPLTLKIVENRSRSINKAAMAKPAARCMPLPPLIRREASMAPINVNIITVTGVASRRYSSTSRSLMPSDPLNFSISTMCLSSLVVRRLFTYSSRFKSSGVKLKSILRTVSCFTSSPRSLIFLSITPVSFHFFFFFFQPIVLAL